MYSGSMSIASKYWLKGRALSTRGSRCSTEAVTAETVTVRHSCSRGRPETRNTGFARPTTAQAQAKRPKSPRTHTPCAARRNSSSRGSRSWGGATARGAAGRGRIPCRGACRREAPQTTAAEAGSHAQCESAGLFRGPCRAGPTTKFGTAVATDLCRPCRHVKTMPGRGTLSTAEAAPTTRKNASIRDQSRSSTVIMSCFHSRPPHGEPWPLGLSGSARCRRDGAGRTR